MAPTPEEAAPLALPGHEASAAHEAIGKPALAKPQQRDDHNIAFSSNRHPTFTALVPAKEVRSKSTARARLYVQSVARHGGTIRCLGCDEALRTCRRSSGADRPATSHVSCVGLGRSCDTCSLFCQARHPGQVRAVRLSRSKSQPGRVEISLAVPKFLSQVQPSKHLQREPKPPLEDEPAPCGPRSRKISLRSAFSQLVGFAGWAKHRLGVDYSPGAALERLASARKKLTIDEQPAEDVIAIVGGNRGGGTTVDPQQLVRRQPGDGKRTRVGNVIGEVSQWSKQGNAYLLRLHGWDTPLVVPLEMAAAIRKSYKRAYWRLNRMKDTRVVALISFYPGANGAVTALQVDLVMCSTVFIVVDSLIEARLANFLVTRDVEFNKPQHGHKRRREGDFIPDFILSGIGFRLLLEVVGLVDPTYQEDLHRKRIKYDELRTRSQNEGTRYIDYYCMDVTRARVPTVPAKAILDALEQAKHQGAARNRGYADPD